MNQKPTIKERLQKKTLKEINAIAKRMKYPVYGTKPARIHQIDQLFRAPAIWDAIVNGGNI